MDKRVHELSDDTSRLAFTWLVAFADCEGRVHGDPAIVKSLVFPRREVDVQAVELYITEWAEAGLVVWYEECGDKWIWFPAFDKNQQGLRKNREPASVIPQYAAGESQLCADDCRQSAGCLPDVCRQSAGLREENRKEENRTEPEFSLSDFLSKAHKAYESEIGMLSTSQIEDVDSFIADLENRGLESWWFDALTTAANANARSWNYVRKVLTNCLDSGKPPRPRETGPPKLHKKTICVIDPLTNEIERKEVMVP